MKLDVRFDISANNSPIYSMILQNVIKKISKKIGEDFYNIKWVIFDTNNRRKNNTKNELMKVSPLFIVSQGADYGFYDYKSQEIWISTMALRSSGWNNLSLPNLISGRNKPDLLVNVILDELAHLKTGEDHGSREYDNQLKMYRNRHYTKLY